MCYAAFKNDSHFSDISHWSLISRAIFIFLDEKIAFNLKTASQIFMLFYVLMYFGSNVEQ